MSDALLPPLLFVILVFFSAFQQTLSGFGFALVLMPIATMIFGLRTASSLVALIAITLYAINLFRYKHAVNVREVLRLGTAAAVGAPIGVWALINLDEVIVKALLGLLLIGYALYSLANPVALRVESERWGYLAGFLGGCLGGAYNVPGPPMVIYGSLRAWEKDEFRAVLQAIFLVSGTLTVASHLIAGRVTPNVLVLYAASLPALLIAIWDAARVDARVNRPRFRMLVIVMVLVMGISTILELIGK